MTEEEKRELVAFFRDLAVIVDNGDVESFSAKFLPPRGHWRYVDLPLRMGSGELMQDPSGSKGRVRMSVTVGDKFDGLAGLIGKYCREKIP